MADRETQILDAESTDPNSIHHDTKPHTSTTTLSIHAADPDSSLSLAKDIEKAPTPSTISSISSPPSAEPDPDPNLISWSSPSDPTNPLNWPSYKKWSHIALISIITFLTQLASSMFAPGVPQVMRTFHSTNNMLEGFMVSVYVLGYAFGPLFIAPLSEMWGRLPLYHACNVLFLVFHAAAGASENMGVFVVLRFLNGCVGGAPIVLGGGTIADLMSPEQRGTAMAVWFIGPTIGPCVGPVLGGVFTAEKGWRWNFWFVTIVAGFFTLVCFVVMRETSAVVILGRKAKRLRRETGNGEFRSKLDKGLSTKELFLYSIVRPTKMLTRSAICFSMSLYVGLTYAYLYILFTTFTSVYSTQYGWHGVTLGLSFLGIGIGSLIGLVVVTHFGNKVPLRHMKLGDFKPEHRLYIMAQGSLALPVGLFWYGWAVEAKTHYIVPMIGTAFIGFGMMLNFNPPNTYLVDVFTIYAASAMAASTVLRSLMGALLPLSSKEMYAKLGYGWGNSLLAFVSLALVPIPFVFIRYGERIRKASKVTF